MPAGEGIALEYRLAAPDVGGCPLEVTVRQFLLLSGGTGHVLTVTGPHSDEFSAVVAEIADSIKLLD